MPRSRTQFGRYIERGNPSTRVLAPPGGASSLSLVWNEGGDEAPTAATSDSSTWSAPSQLQQSGYSMLSAGAESPGRVSMGTFARGGGGGGGSEYYAYQSPRQQQSQRNPQRENQANWQRHYPQISHTEQHRPRQVDWDAYANEARYSPTAVGTVGAAADEDSWRYMQLVEDSKHQIAAAALGSYGNPVQQHKYTDSAYVSESGVVHDSLSKFIEPMPSPHGVAGESRRRTENLEQGTYRGRNYPRQEVKKKKKSIAIGIGFGSSVSTNRGLSGGAATQRGRPKQGQQPAQTLSERRRRELDAAKVNFSAKVQRAARASGTRINTPTPRGKAERQTRGRAHGARRGGKYQQLAASTPMRELSKPLLESPTKTGAFAVPIRIASSLCDGGWTSSSNCLDTAA